MSWGPLFRKLWAFAFSITLISVALSVAFMRHLMEQERVRIGHEQLTRDAQWVRSLLGSENMSQWQDILRRVPFRAAWWQGGQLRWSNDDRPPVLPSPLPSAALTYELEHEPALAVPLDLQKPSQGTLVLVRRRPQMGPPPHARPPGMRPPQGGAFPPFPPGGPPPGGGPHPGGGPLGSPGPSAWLMATLLMVVSLGGLLIPYTRYVTRPFQQLLLSINQVALGDFQTPIPLPVQREFRLIAEAFNQMTARIQEHMQQKQRLLADVSHELRSPLARMRVSLDLLEREGQASEKYLHKLVREVEQLDTLIDHLLDVSRLELDAGYQPRRLTFDVWLQEWLDKNKLLIEDQRLHVRWQNEAQGIKARVDEALMERALNNLLSNVLKHAPSGSELLMGLRRQEDMLVLDVLDQGPGVPPEDLEKIFEPFYRSDSSRSRKTGGHGLGLAIVRKIILLHQGRIVAQRPPSGGFCMTIYLPIVA